MPSGEDITVGGRGRDSWRGGRARRSGMGRGRGAGGEMGGHAGGCLFPVYTGLGPKLVQHYTGRSYHMLSYISYLVQGSPPGRAWGSGANTN